MSPALRKLALTVHLTTSLGWVGAVVAYLGLGIAAVESSDTETIRAAWTAMEVTGWWVIVPLAIAALVTGVVMSLRTRWGLFRHYWTVISLALMTLCTLVLVLHMPAVTATARVARTVEGGDLRMPGGDLFHPGAGLLLSLAITVLNVYKPEGLTPTGGANSETSGVRCEQSRRNRWLRGYPGVSSELERFRLLSQSVR